MKRFISLTALVVATALSVLAQPNYDQTTFVLGVSLTGSNPIWGDNDSSTPEIIVGPGETFYLHFGGQWRPNSGGSDPTAGTAWAIINGLIDLTRQDPNSPVGENYTSAFTGLNSFAWTFAFSALAISEGWILQVGGGFRAVRANSETPFANATTQFPLVTPQGAAIRVWVPGGTSYNLFMEMFTVRVTVGSAPFGSYEFSPTRLAGFNSAGQGALIGVEGVTVRSNFGTNAGRTIPENSNYGQRIGVTVLVPEPASMIALSSGLVGLLALRRRRSN